jgi:hypothetical protein
MRTNSLVHRSGVAARQDELSSEQTAPPDASRQAFGPAKSSIIKVLKGSDRHATCGFRDGMEAQHALATQEHSGGDVEGRSAHPGTREKRDEAIDSNSRLLVMKYVDDYRVQVIRERDRELYMELGWLPCGVRDPFNSEEPLPRDDSDQRGDAPEVNSRQEDDGTWAAGFGHGGIGE